MATTIGTASLPVTNIHATNADFDILKILQHIETYQLGTPSLSGSGSVGKIYSSHTIQQPQKAGTQVLASKFEQHAPLVYAGVGSLIHEESFLATEFSGSKNLSSGLSNYPSATSKWFVQEQHITLGTPTTHANIFTINHQNVQRDGNGNVISSPFNINTDYLPKCGHYPLLSSHSSFDHTTNLNPGDLYIDVVYFGGGHGSNVTNLLCVK